MRRFQPLNRKQSSRQGLVLIRKFLDSAKTESNRLSARRGLALVSLQADDIRTPKNLRKLEYFCFGFFFKYTFFLIWQGQREGIY
jgi:hypothetical protein